MENEMTKKQTDEGYVPQTFKKGYQPQKSSTEPTGDPKPQGGYVPTGAGDNPANTPTPPSDE